MKSLKIIAALLFAGSLALVGQMKAETITNNCGDKFMHFLKSVPYEGKFADFDATRPVSEYNPETVAITVNFEISFPIGRDLLPLKEYIIKKIMQVDNTSDPNVAAERGAKKIFDDNCFYFDDPHYDLAVTAGDCSDKWLVMDIDVEYGRGDLPNPISLSRSIFYDRELQAVIPPEDIISDFGDKGLLALVNKAIADEYHELGLEGSYRYDEQDTLFPNIVVAKDGIYFCFNRYSIPWWNEGAASYLIPYSDLRPYLTPYFIKVMGL